MTELSNTDLFTKKHARLTMIARFANVFAWIILIVNIVLVIWNIYIQFISADMQRTSLIQLLQNSGFRPGLVVIVNNLANLIEGFVWWLVLKGVALGLLMIVETDVNYRLQNEGGSHE